jgi:DNA-directed RNA polymerase subunit RPC12/RpoP
MMFETETLHNGADSAVICAHCGSKNVRYGYATNRKHNWWSVFIFAIIALAALSVRSFGVRKAWHCFNCGKDFE